MKKSIDKLSKPLVDSPRRGEWGRMFLDNSEGWRPPSPRTPPSRAWSLAGGEGAGRAGGVRSHSVHLRSQASEETLSTENVTVRPIGSARPSVDLAGPSVDLVRLSEELSERPIG